MPMKLPMVKPGARTWTGPKQASQWTFQIKMPIFCFSIFLGVLMICFLIFRRRNRSNRIHAFCDFGVLKCRQNQGEAQGRGHGGRPRGPAEAKRESSGEIHYERQRRRGRPWRPGWCRAAREWSRERRESATPKEAQVGPKKLQGPLKEFCRALKALKRSLTAFQRPLSLFPPPRFPLGRFSDLQNMDAFGLPKFWAFKGSLRPLESLEGP